MQHAVTPEGNVLVRPQNVSVSDGENATFMCMVDLAGSYELQWSLNGELLSGENQSLLTMNDVTAVQGGTYTCLVVNAVGNDTDEGILYGKHIHNCQSCKVNPGSVQHSFQLRCMVWS